MKKFSFYFSAAVAALVASGCASSSFNDDTAREPSSSRVAGYDPDGQLAFDLGLKDELKKCVNRVNQVCKNISGHDEDRIEDNVAECKLLEGGGKQQQLFRLYNGKIVAITLQGKDRCGRTRYNLGSPAHDMLITEPGTPTAKAWFVTTSGAVFFLNPSERMYQMMSTSGNPYKGVKGVKGTSGGQSFTLEMTRGKDVDIGSAEFAKRKRERVDAEEVPTGRSLFRDE